MPDRSLANPLPPAILIDLDWQQPGRQELAARLIGLLAELGGPVVTTRNERPAHGPIDVVISERPEALAELAWVEPGLIDDTSSQRMGLIVLGQPAARADANLPLDFADRELLLACRLVGEIVHLRRRSYDVEHRSHELARLAAADPLTGLANRRTWNAEAGARLQRAQAAGQAVCLAIFDVDHFKTVNDVHGHPTGDAVLAGIGRELTAALRADDLLARLGGDEFAALLTGSFDEAGALAVIDRVRGAVGQNETARLGFELSLSAGCALQAGDSETDLDRLFAAADAALHAAKRSGRNRTVRGASTEC